MNLISAFTSIFSSHRAKNKWLRWSRELMLASVGTKTMQSDWREFDCFLYQRKCKQWYVKLLLLRWPKSGMPIRRLGIRDWKTLNNKEKSSGEGVERMHSLRNEWMFVSKKELPGNQNLKRYRCVEIFAGKINWLKRFVNQDVGTCDLIGISLTRFTWGKLINS